MELGDDVAWRVLDEMKRYVPFVLPTLLIYTAESNASLKLWHAVRQLPHIEKESSPDDEESRINLEHVYKTRATREVVKKEARRTRIHQFVFGFVLVAIALFDQFVAVRGWLNRSRDGDDFDGYVGSGVGEEEFDGQSGYGYGWYYDSIIGQIDWTRSYYAITLFLPAVYMLSRTIYLFLGLNDRIVLRDTKGVPFMVVVKGKRFIPRRPSWMAISVITISAFAAIVATWYRNPFCVSVVFASMIHLCVSNLYAVKVVSFKSMAVCAFLMMFILAWLLYQMLTIQGSFPVRLFALTQDVGDVNWAGLILTALVCTGSFSHIAMSYRMDHSFARPDELLTGTPDVAISRLSYEREGIEVRGTRITYLSRSCFRPCSSATSFSRPFRWPKPYFHASVFSWLFAYVVIAVATVLGYVECEAEMAGVYVLYISPPTMCLGAFLCALARGEVRRVWAYREDWAGEPTLVPQNGGIGSEVAKVDEEKVLIGGSG